MENFKAQMEDFLENQYGFYPVLVSESLQHQQEHA